MKHDKNFIDFHTHILPGMDDGATDTVTSAKMLYCLKQQNVKTVVLTPHYYADRESQTQFLKRRAAALQKLIPVAEEIQIEVVPACEMYLTDYIFNYDNIAQLCINSGKYLLTELPYSCDFNNTLFHRLTRLLATFNIVPVIAHIERYSSLLKDPGLLQQLNDMGCLAQINLGSLKRGLFKRKIILDDISGSLVHIVGTDCHNLKSRPPQFQDGIQIIEKRLGVETIDSLMNNAMEIIQSNQSKQKAL